MACKLNYITYISTIFAFCSVLKYIIHGISCIGAQASKTRVLGSKLHCHKLKSHLLHTNAVLHANLYTTEPPAQQTRPVTCFKPSFRRLRRHGYTRSRHYLCLAVPQLSFPKTQIIMLLCGERVPLFIATTRFVKNNNCVSCTILTILCI